MLPAHSIPYLVTPSLVVPSTELWIDISNYTGPLSPQQINELKAAHVKGAIVQAITGLDGNSYTVQQLTALRDGNLGIQGYVWGFPGFSVASRLKMFNGFALESLWLDVEQIGLTRANVNRDLYLCDNYQAALAGVYSGRWFFAQQGWLNIRWWANRPLWDANYDGIPVVKEDFRPYGGWLSPVVKQFKGTSSIGTVQEIDLDVLVRSLGLTWRRN